MNGHLLIFFGGKSKRFSTKCFHLPSKDILKVFFVCFLNIFLCVWFFFGGGGQEFLAALRYILDYMKNTPWVLIKAVGKAAHIPVSDGAQCNIRQ